MPRGIGYGFGPYAPEPYDDRGADRISNLILQKGAIGRDRSIAKGAAIGGAVGALGQGAADVLGALGVKKELESEQAKYKEFARFLGETDGDPRKITAVSVEMFGPEVGLPAAETAIRLTTPMLDPELAPAEKAKNLGMALKLAGTLPEGMKRETFPLLMRAVGPTLQELAALGGVEMDMSQLPSEYTPELEEAAQQIASGLLGEEAAEPIKLGKDDRLVTAGGEEIVGAAPTPEDPLKVEEQRLKNEKLKVELERLRADPERPAPSLGDVDKLAQRWSAATEETRSINRQVKIMEEGLVSARKGDLAAGSQAILVTFQKILDPTSVVRESEYARSAAGQSAIARAEGIIDRLSKGGAGVPVNELEKFADLAKRMSRAGASGYLEAERERLGKLADQYNVDRDLVFPDFDFAAPEDTSQKVGRFTVEVIE